MNQNIKMQNNKKSQIQKISKRIEGTEMKLEEKFEIVPFMILTRETEGATRDRWRLERWEVREMDLLKREIPDLTRLQSAITEKTLILSSFSERVWFCSLGEKQRQRGTESE